MNKLLALCICFFIIAVAQAQTKSIIILDEITKKPLPFATIECFGKKWGSYADTAGKIKIEKDLLANDTMVISFVGYDSKTYDYSNLPQQVFLISKKLPDVVISTCNKVEKKIAGLKKNGAGTGFGFGSKPEGKTWGSYISNAEGKSGYIQSLFYIAKRGWDKDSKLAPTRLRIFEYDTIKKLPGIELTPDEIIFTPGHFGKNTMDMSMYKMKMPVNGIVVCFEMFDSGPQYYYKWSATFEDGKKHTKTSYGYTIGGLRAENAKCFSYALGFGFYKFEAFDKSAPNFRVAVNYCK